MHIHINQITQNKQPTHPEQIDYYVDRLERRLKIRPITLRKSGEVYVLVDGRHRLAAHKILGKEMIEVMVTL